MVFPQGDPHVLSSAPGMRAQPMTPEQLDTVTSGPLPFFQDVYNDGGANRPPTVKLVCGFLACDAQPFNPLLQHLPPAGDRPMLKAIARRAIWENPARREILTRYLTTDAAGFLADGTLYSASTKLRGDNTAPIFTQLPERAQQGDAVGERGVVSVEDANDAEVLIQSTAPLT